MGKEKKYPMKTKICPYCNGTGYIETEIDAEATAKMMVEEIFSEIRKGREK